MIERELVFKKLVPIGLIFAVSISCGNIAYTYSSVPFLQMCKAFNSVLVFCISLAIGTVKFTFMEFTLILMICIAVMCTVTGEVEPSMMGLMFQGTSQLFEVSKVALQSKIMTEGEKLDPMSFLLVQVPVTLLGLISYIALTHGVAFNAYYQTVWLSMKANRLHLIMNSMNAFLLNCAIALTIDAVKGIRYIMIGIVKDIMIVCMAVVLFKAHLSQQQFIFYPLALVSIGMHVVFKRNQERFLRDGALKTVCMLLMGVPMKKQKHSLGEA